MDIKKPQQCCGFAPLSRVELNQVIEDLRVIYRLSALFSGSENVYY